MGGCSNIREKINISNDVIIGMNAAVVKNIEESGIYIGVPSKKL
jgi:UDP-3-O-[3-hydroxymyristoyl] glucosamine N-acyltransferase